MTETVPHRYRNQRGKLTIGWRFIAGLSFGVLLATLVSIVKIFPYKPETWIGWCLVVIFVPLGEILGEVVWGFWLSLGERFAPDKAKQTVSSARISIALAGALLLLGSFYMVFYFVGPPIAAFLSPHFSAW